MSLIAMAGCALGRHEPLRRNVKWGGSGYVGTCRHCGAPIMRIAHRKWRTRED